ncbi:MAG TPA: malto-oligosyltrehalose trehalohydrolase, partial [Thermoplasmataceae archaeon]|nr:malto-oligosyltrehalose trehalohydrolase [Thermoplasmataceae archaeon]
EGIANELKKDDDGFWSFITEDTNPIDYSFILDKKKKIPDPASRFQPAGIFGASRTVVFPDDLNPGGYSNIDLRNAVIYELHTGTFTPEGTFKGMVNRLDHLESLGINAVEIMPIAQFEGRWNWGYDGVFPYAVHSEYGGPLQFLEFVKAAHERRISVILDVVYNHLGPRGNIFPQVGPYFSPRYHTPWGDALNFDGPMSPNVRNFFIQNAIYWLDRFDVDGLRLDAVHAIVDNSSCHFLEELAVSVRNFFGDTGKKPILIAESDMNDPKLIQPSTMNGYGLDAQWCDDFHHSLHAYVAGERDGYYMDYGEEQQIERSLRSGFVYQGEFSKFLKRYRGSRDFRYTLDQLIVFSQDHDQVGNRPLSDRPAAYMGLNKSLSLVFITLLSPFTPMLFMGEEFQTKSPFWFFIDTDDIEYARIVDEGRKNEFSYFQWVRDNQIRPSDPEAFYSSKIQWSEADTEAGREIQEAYRLLIRLRRTHAIGGTIPDFVRIQNHILKVRYSSSLGKLEFAANLSDQIGIWVLPADFSVVFKWNVSSSAGRYELEPFGFIVAEKINE